MERGPNSGEPLAGFGPTGGEQYEKMTLHAQILKRPDMYVGSPAGITQEDVWIAREVGDGTIKVECISVPVSKAIIGISKEVFDNATDNAERSRVEHIEPGPVYVYMSENSLTVRNHGKHIPIVIHHKEGIWVPQMLFGELLTSDNYNDSIDRFKIGRNGYGVKLCNIFSVAFQVTLADPDRRQKYTQTWSRNMYDKTEPTIEPYEGPAFTQVTFVPDFNYFYEGQHGPTFLEAMHNFYFNRTMESSFAAQIVATFNNMTLDYRDAVKYFETHFDGFDPQRRMIHWISDDKKNEFVVADTPGKGWCHAFVNGTPVHQGEHVNEYIRVIFQSVSEEFEKKHNKKVRVDQLKKHVSLLLRVTLDKPKFDSQIKRKLEKPKPKVVLPKNIQKDALKWTGLEEELRKAFNMKSNKATEAKNHTERVFKVDDALQANSTSAEERMKNTLIITEGETGKTLASKGLKFLPGGIKYNGIYPIRGKTMNTDRHKAEDVDRNKELSDIMKILGADQHADYFKDRKAFLKLRYHKIALMTDADHDGYHIIGLMIRFVFDRLKTLAPFEFVLVIPTPIIDATKGKQRMTFYQQREFARWTQANETKGWEFKYKKGLGSWNTDPATLKLLFENPQVIPMIADPTTQDVLQLAFNKKFTQQRKEWISAHDPNAEIVIKIPRPITDFFMGEFRDYSKAAVVRAIPSLMDGMKPVHRKILYTMFKRWTLEMIEKRKKIKVPQFGGQVMETAVYHHGEGSLYKTIIGMGQRYVTGPNNLPMIEGEGNFGDRRQRGADQSPARYLECGLHPIARKVYRREDDALWEILYDDGVPVEPKEMYPIIPMCLVNKCEGIGTGWSTKIPCHDPRVILEWVKQWVLEKKEKRFIPRAQLEIDVKSKPELIPWWRDYRGTLVRIKNQPHEVYRNEGRFDFQFHTTFVQELPAETAPENYKIWGETQEELFHKEPEKAILRTFIMASEPPNIDFRISGMSTPTLAKLNLIRTINLSNLTLIDKDGTPKKYAYNFEIICEWCSDRFEIYEKRRLNLIKENEEKLRKTALKYLFVMDVIEGRLVLAKRRKAEIIPYMQAKGYPCNKKRDGDDFLEIPIGSITFERSEKLRKEVLEIQKLLEYYKSIWSGDLWLSDLEELKAAIDQEYTIPLY